MNNPRKSSSFFWPVVLIGAGVILLLVNLEIIPAINLGQILRLWPLILVVIGLDIIFGRRAPWVGGAIGLVAIGGVIALLIFGPALGLTYTTNVKTDTISTPLGEATSAVYYLETSSDPVHIKSLSDSTNLIEGTITHDGTLNFDVSGSSEKVVRLSETTNPNFGLQFDFNFVDQKWDIGLNPGVPSELVLDGGSGSVNVDLSDVMLTSLRAAMGSGSSDFILPLSVDAYTAEIESGSGSVKIDLPAETDVVLSLDSGSGSVNINLPPASGLRIEIMGSGSGSMNIPARMEQVNGTSTSETGTWQTSGFDKAANKIVIKIVNRGSGSISIHQ